MINWDIGFRVVNVISLTGLALLGMWAKYQLEKIKGDLEQTRTKLSASLEKSVHVHKVQFEKEFQVYEKIWAELVSLQDITISLRPGMDFFKPGESEEERKRKRIDAFNKVYQSFRGLVDKSRPFYPESIYKHLDKLMQLARSESIDYSYLVDKDRDYWKQGKENAELIIKGIEEVCEAIRKRIASVEIV